VNEKLVLVKPPKFVDLKVKKVERKNQAWEIFNTKNVLLETGVWLNVPLQVEKDDIIKIDTINNKFVSKI
ncbi:MAG: hypothetical protein IJW82_02115, partial [Clostridia bacterium]|nr:hypothetical protein [Clostridia bacterium]